MPIFLCSKCKMMEDTAFSNYWTRDFIMPDGSPPQPALCSECDPGIAKWHGAFPRGQIPADYVVGPDGFVYHNGDEYLKRLLQEPPRAAN